MTLGRTLLPEGASADRLSLQLQDQNDNVIAFFRPTRPQRYNIGEVHGELHFVRNAGAGVVVRFPSQPFSAEGRGSLIDGSPLDRAALHRCTLHSWTR